MPDSPSPSASPAGTVAGLTSAAQQSRLAAIVETSDDAIISKDLHGVVLTWNGGAERIFGWTAAEAVGKPINFIIPPERQAEEPEILRRLRNGERVDHFETVRLTKSGQRIDVSVSISPVRDETGAIVAASKIARDITARKQAEALLQEAKREAERANQAKDAFLSVLSHELRAPLAPVLMELSFLEEAGGLAEDIRERMRMIRANVEAETRLVDDLLDATRIRHGKVRLVCQPVGVNEAIQGALRMLEPAIRRKRIRVTTTLEPAERRMWADPGRIQQILTNLIGNAVKFSPEDSGIEITAHGAGNRVRIAIRDHGAGIAPEFLPRLFQRFEQAAAPGSGGLGLGLAIARGLAELHRGSIQAASAGLGQGATFTLALPVAAAGAAPGARPPRRAAERSAAGMRVLLAEDHTETRAAMARLLRHLGCTVVEAGSVREALAAGGEGRFDLLLSDLWLPDGDGSEIMRVLRASGVRGAAISGLGEPEALERCRSAGFERHLTKPLTFQDLRELVASFIPRAS